MSARGHASPQQVHTARTGSEIFKMAAVGGIYNRNCVKSMCVFFSVTLTYSSFTLPNKKLVRKNKSRHTGNAAHENWESKNATRLPKTYVAKHPRLPCVLPPHAKCDSACLRIERDVYICAKSSFGEKLRFLNPPIAVHENQCWNYQDFPRCTCVPRIGRRTHIVT